MVELTTVLRIPHNTNIRDTNKSANRTEGLSAGIYLRISDDKEDRELSVTRQEEDCRRLADRLGVNVVGVYKDNDISASTRTKSAAGYGVFFFFVC